MVGAKAVAERVRKMVVTEYQNELAMTMFEISGARVRSDGKEHCMTL